MKERKQQEAHVAQPDGDAIDAKPVRRSFKRWLIALSVAVVLVLAGVVAVSVLNQERTAQAAVEQYYNALAAGDATTANSLLPADRFRGRGPDLLTDEVLGNAVELISDVSVVTVDENWSGAYVKASYTLAGTRYFETMYVSPGEREWGFLKTYRLNRPREVDITPRPPTQSAFTFAGVTMSSKTPHVQVFPAVYPVAAVDPTYFDVAHDTIEVNGVESPSDVELVATSMLEEEIQAQVNAALDECAANTHTAKAIPRCQLDYPLARGTVGTWEILEYPTLEAGLGVGQFFGYTNAGLARFTPADGTDPIEIEDLMYQVNAEVVDGELYTHLLAR